MGYQMLISLLLLAMGVANAAEVVHRTRSATGTELLVEELTRGQGVPWALAFVDANSLLFTERRGTLKRLRLEDGRVTPVAGVPRVMTGGQGGLLDIVRARIRGQDWYYLTWVKAVRGQGVTVLSRAQLGDGRLIHWQDLLVTRSATDTGRHFGSRILVDGKGYLFFGIGDRGHRPNGQDLSTHAGKILRLTLEGEVPRDNPFVDQPGALPEIWSLGHRNPQGLALDPVHDRIWVNEHGPRGGDEINLLRKGGNYGWPILSHGREYWGPFAVGEDKEREGMLSPIKVYVPSIAPGSLLLYQGDAFPHWRGNLFSGALAMTHLNRVELNEAGEAAGEERLLETLGERIRALAEGPEGWLYFSTDSGRILRLRPAGS